MRSRNVPHGYFFPTSSRVLPGQEVGEGCVPRLGGGGSRRGGPKEEVVDADFDLLRK